MRSAHAVHPPELKKRAVAVAFWTQRLREIQNGSGSQTRGKNDAEAGEDRDVDGAADAHPRPQAQDNSTRAIEMGAVRTRDQEPLRILTSAASQSARAVARPCQRRKRARDTEHNRTSVANADAAKYKGNKRTRVAKCPP